ncbi:MAG: hypothetical protein ACTTJF_08970 [Campylobacter sp.]|uniref:hypothetical protein n=1 Tax=Campylobacter sp. TaxID=205 RepID=UPI003F9FD55A
MQKSTAGAIYLLQSFLALSTLTRLHTTSTLRLFFYFQLCFIKFDADTIFDFAVRDIAVILGLIFDLVFLRGDAVFAVFNCALFCYKFD